MDALQVLAIISGYLLGSIPSSYLIGRLWRGIDLRQEGSSHVSATAVYREVGRIPFLVVVFMDVGKAILAIYLATLLTDSMPVIVATAYATVIGHCWSVFIGFKGGLGALVTYAVLGRLALWEFFIGVAVAIIILLTTRKSSLSTYILLAVASLALLIEHLFIEQKGLLLVLFPLGIIPIQLLKRLLSQKTGNIKGYKDELFNDLKTIK